MLESKTTRPRVTSVKPQVLEEWIDELEKFYPNRGDHVVGWRRSGAQELFEKIYNAGVEDGELIENAKRNIRI